MDINRKAWNDRHKALRKALENKSNCKSAIELFLIQHGMVHSAKLSKPSIHSFEDEILNDLPMNAWRYIPPNGNHSIAWIIWHLARVEDVTMNLLIANKQQVLNKNGWLQKLRIEFTHTGNDMSNEKVHDLNNRIDVSVLREYWLAVAGETRKIVKELEPANYKQKVDPSQIQRIWDEHAMLPGGKAIVNYWASRTIVGLLLMPPTRHCILHLNEANRIKAGSFRSLS